MAGLDVPGCGRAKHLGYASWRAGAGSLPGVRALGAIVAVGVACSGCGGGEHHAPKTPTYTSAGIVEHFKRETGDTLVPGRVHAAGLESLSTEFSDPQLVAKYGHFDIYVVTPAAKVRYLIGADPGEKVEGPDSNGTYWTHTCPPKFVGAPCYWLIQRRYGANVVLSWIGGAARKTDARFARLTNVLARLP
jgi:hypothetical protein